MNDSLEGKKTKSSTEETGKDGLLMISCTSLTGISTGSEMKESKQV